MPDAQTDQTSEVVQAAISDPDSIPVRFVTGSAALVVNDLIALTLTTDRIGYHLDGRIEPDVVLAGRFRLPPDATLPRSDA